MSEKGPGPSPKESSPILPFTAKNILQICWSLTLILSHEGQQNKLGETFETYFMNVFKLYDKTGAKDDSTPKQGSEGAHPNDGQDGKDGKAIPPAPSPAQGEQATAKKTASSVDANKPQNGQPPGNTVEPAFVQNLVMSLAKNIRDIGFVRDNHVRYLDFMSEELGQTIQFYNDIADFTSTSSSSIITKVVSFLGVGSSVDLATKGNSFTPLSVAIFTIFGLVGATIVTAILKYVRSGRIESEYRKVEKRQNDYWHDHFKKDMANQLLIQYKEFVELVKRYYPNQYEQIRNSDSLLSMSSEGEVRDVIWFEILPSDDISWPPYITSQSPSPKSDGQPQAAPKSSPSPAPTKAAAK